ncbi:MAG: homocysteine S-methyltransferase family protein, partial [Candidatus Omnitrophica bacterium]|nr:homocysteine S-methyltransferase family protein [Candidatus Omnitrophota bacterium]
YTFGDIGPTGELLFPLGELEPGKLKDIFIEQVKGLLSGGVDGFICETFWDIEELKIATDAIRELIDLPVFASMSFQPGKNGYRTMMGLEVKEAAVRMNSLDCQAIGANCGCGIEEMINIITEMRKVTKKPLLAEPNAGMPKLIEGQTVFEQTPADMAKYAPVLLKAGANIIGGCCGTTPSHLRSISSAVVK